MYKQPDDDKNISEPKDHHCAYRYLDAKRCPAIGTCSHSIKGDKYTEFYCDAHHYNENPSFMDMLRKVHNPQVSTMQHKFNDQIKIEQEEMEIVGFETYRKESHARLKSFLVGT